MRDFKDLIIHPRQSIREAMAAINRNAKGIVLIADPDRRLLGTITDGNIRRAILEGASLHDKINTLIGTDPEYPDPVVAQQGMDQVALLKLMQQHGVHQLPLLDGDGRVIDLVTMDDLLPGSEMSLSAVVMAGGLGTRLHPLTEDLPKPMLPVGGRPLMEHIIKGLRDAGITRVNVTTNYKAEVISAHFGDGADFGVSMQYVAEDQPLGTAGALGLMDAPDQPFLVINGDILTRVDFNAMLGFHKENRADLTVGVREFDFKVPYGVVETDGVAVQTLKEKPVIRFFVNAGIYLLEPHVHRFILNGEHVDMTDLIGRLLENKKRVISFPICEYWLDIGQPDDYQQAQEDVKSEGF